jgi:hypothetical protein
MVEQPSMTIKVTVAPKGMGLNDFVAMQDGFFTAEGLDVEFDMKTFRGTQGSWKFSRGERFVYEPIPQSEFSEIMEQVGRWNLDQHLKERTFEKLIPSAA